MSGSEFAAHRVRLADYRIDLRSRDWRPIPLNGKTPTVKGWQAYATSPPTDFEIRAYGSALNTGTVLTDDLLVVDIDELDEDRAAAMEALAADILGPTTFRRVGKAPKVALLYRLSGPVQPRSLPSLDILTRGRQLVISGIHPDTGLPYVWTGEHSPDNASPAAALEIHPEQVERFIAAAGHSSTPSTRRSSAATDQPFTVCSDGHISDGREGLLRDLIYQVACRRSEGGLSLAIDEIASEAWAPFTDRADLSDQKWHFRHAVAKASAIVRRVKAGTVALPSPISVEPAYLDKRHELQVAEDVLPRSIDEFFETVVVPWVDQRAIDINGSAHPSLSWAIRVETGVGKTTQAIAAALRALSSRHYLQIVIAVPTHALADEVVATLRAKGCDALAYRGYTTPDPLNFEHTMCRDLEAFEHARLARVPSIKHAICHDAEYTRRCKRHQSCGMTRQRLSQPRIWVIPHALLFSARPSCISRPTACIVDESFLLKAIPDEPVTLTLDELLFETNGLTSELADARRELHKALTAAEVGPVTSATLSTAGLTTETAEAARSEEIALAQVTGIFPGMNATDRRKLASEADASNKIAWAMSGIWQEVRRVLAAGVQSSGRLGVIYDGEAKTRVITHCALRTIHRSWQAPNLFLDATLPDPALFNAVVGHPVHLQADISVRWPEHVRVRQILHAPVSAKKMGLRVAPSSPNRAVAEIREFVLARAGSVDAGEEVLVVGQKRFVERLKLLGLPRNVRTAHFGALAGLDSFRDVAGLICVGRPQPPRDVIDRMTDILTGDASLREPEIGLPWFPRVVKGLRCTDGAVVSTEHYEHPDPRAEALRRQTCEAELIQAIGRIRPCRRAAPAFIDLLTDVPLPIVINEIKRWNEVRVAAPEPRLIEEGIILESPEHLHLCFPDLWNNADAARKWLDRRASGQRPIEDILYRQMSACCRYKMPGRGQKWRKVRYNPRRIACPRTWIEARAGEIADFALI